MNSVQDDNEERTDQFNQFVSSMMKNFPLKSLDLSFNKRVEIKGKKFRYLCKTELQIDDNRVLTSLTRIDISSSQMSEQSIKNLLTICPNLQSLSATECPNLTIEMIPLTVSFLLYQQFSIHLSRLKN